MRYEWEDEARKMLVHLAEIYGGRSQFEVIGLAVRNVDNGEACLLDFDCFEGLGGVVGQADAWKDINGDAQRIYVNRINQMREAFNDLVPR